MKKTSLSILFLFLFMQILNFKVYGDMHDMPMDMPSVDQKVYTKKISVPDTPQKVKDATLSKQEVLNSFNNMDLKVDEQNASDKNYKKLSDDIDSPAFLAALELVFEGRNQSCGYIEEIMFKYRRVILNESF